MKLFKLIYRFFIYKKIEKIIKKSTAAQEKLKTLFKEINDYFDIQSRYLEQQSKQIAQARIALDENKNDTNSLTKVSLALRKAQSPFATNHSKLIDEKSDEMDQVIKELYALDERKKELYKKIGRA